ncbi:MAG TPA: alpha/beta fold hydrolase [Steroidobacteraceae bacterium]|nr:alpha/beta fold hydrolase [Steroidobacteraceae bacterium]
MPHDSRFRGLPLGLILMLAALQHSSAAPPDRGPSPPAEVAAALQVSEADYSVRDFRFDSGRTLPALRLHYATLGHPRRDGNGRIVNAVLILHGTGGSGHQFLGANFAGVLFGPGELLDASKYFIILPDDIGHGHSSKPSDGLRAQFPHYDYGDMVRAEYLVVTQALHVNHLRLLAGTSMGCMHTWMWAERYPEFMDAALPLACLTIQISGRNRMIRRMMMDSIRDDPAWNHGNYTQEPQCGIRGALNLLFVLGSAPLYDQMLYPTQQLADRAAGEFMTRELRSTDANDMLYQFDSSRDYDPSARLDTVKTHVVAINSADDQVNPPELNIMPREIHKVAHGEFVLLPITAETRGHGTHSLPAIWKPYLAKLLAETD